MYLFEKELTDFPCGWNRDVNHVREHFKELYQNYAKKMKDIFNKGVIAEDIKELLKLEKILFMLIIDWNGALEEVFFDFETYDNELPACIPNNEFFDLYEWERSSDEIDNLIKPHRLFV